MQRRRELAVGLLAVASVALGACASSSSQAACADVGAIGGIQVTLPPAAHTASGAITVKACAGADCETHTGRLTPGPGSVPIVGSRLHGPDPVRVSLVIHDHAGHLLFSGSTTVTPQKVQPNGPSCPPTVWVGHVVASGTSTMTSKAPAD